MRKFDTLDFAKASLDWGERVPFDERHPRVREVEPQVEDATDGNALPSGTVRMLSPEFVSIMADVEIAHPEKELSSDNTHRSRKAVLWPDSSLP